MTLADWLEERRHRRWKKLHRWDALATYQAEQRRGVVHTAYYDDIMRREQERFDARGETA